MEKFVKHRFLNSVLFTALFVPLGFFLLRDAIAAITGIMFLKLYSAFPRHLLTVISCASIIVVLILGMQKRWKTRILSAATTVLLTAGVIIWAVLNERVI